MKIFFNKLGSALAFGCLLGSQFVGELCAADVPSKQPGPTGVLADNGVFSISLPHFEPVMPSGSGRAAFMVICVSCHTPRYVVMQPPFSRVQWHGIVDKMVKVFGASADTNQVGEIVDYLCAINSTTPAASRQNAASANEDVTANPKANTKHAVEAGPIFMPITDAKGLAVEVQRGAELFSQDCAGCHGPTGHGDGFVSRVLLPRPANLSAARFSPELISAALWDGVPGTTMPSWRGLTKEDLTGLVAYVQTLHPGASAAMVSDQSVGRGQTLFRQACAPCHGIHGDGKSAAAATLAPAPTNFQLEQPDFNYVLQVLREGVPGTAMPIWKSQLSESDRAAVANYVRSLYELSPSNKK